MKRGHIILMALLFIAIVGGLAYAFFRTNSKSSVSETEVQSTSIYSPETNRIVPAPEDVALMESKGASKYTAKISEGEVTVELTPKDFKNGIFKVGFAMNTHTVNMKQINLKAQTFLELNGKRYFPNNNPSLGGHHNSGTLEFSVPQKPTNFRIIMNDIPDIDKREFTWVDKK
jgi:hypothetical protein